MTDTCEKCGAEIRVGDWAWCPHGRKGAFTNIADDVPGGFVVENGFDTPQRFFSHSEHRRALAARGMEIRAKYAGENDKHLSNWAAGIDAYTLENARQLLSRGITRKPNPEPDPRKEFPITVTELKDTFRYKVEP